MLSRRISLAQDLRLRPSRSPWLPFGLGLLVATLSGWSPPCFSAEIEEVELPLSEETQECIMCHEMLHPGLVADWRSSRHARTTPEAARAKEQAERRMSGNTVPEELLDIAVGCYECHSLNQEQHKDSFEHEGLDIHVIVTPNDCKTCHPVEVEQYSGSKKAHALVILKDNPLFHQWIETLTTTRRVSQGAVIPGPANSFSENNACYSCHGTEIKVDGMKTVDLGDGEEIEVPNLLNWPNHGVGRINPDGSRGACTSCHARHSFSIAVARKPYTCAQCHLAPDAPAWEVYKESKHGNLMLSKEAEFNWDAVPWTVGTDFTAPSCATCHNSLLVAPDGELILERNHDFGSRLWVRIFGLPYSHPQPKEGDTTIIRNSDGQPLPTAFSGRPAFKFLLNRLEQQERQDLMRKACVACHSTDFANRHFDFLQQANRDSDRMTRAATDLMKHAWDKKLADPENPFDELTEFLWQQEWLFYGNSYRYAYAMGGPDYATFKNGWWELHRNLLDLERHIKSDEAGVKREE